MLSIKKGNHHKVDVNTLSVGVVNNPLSTQATWYSCFFLVRNRYHIVRFKRNSHKIEEKNMTKIKFIPLIGNRV